MVRTYSECKIFLFMDDSTAEGACYKGNSLSLTLFELVVRLQMLVMRAGLILHFILVSGKRMIAQGTDGPPQCSYKTVLTPRLAKQASTCNQNDSPKVFAHVLFKQFG